ncbi:unnamed protein product [Haemonchus placei]|uniref:Transmembrane protein 107 n=1 Tax=Haemonchus placei TaxID=6290 RepID=A0A0N4WIT2_HAEPC|nr:unnamed protein product [Haemonchus placei]
MIDTISGYFLCLLAHIALTCTLFFNQFLLASFPLCTTVIREDSRVEFVVLLSLALVIDASELAILLLRAPSVPVALISSCFHAVSCLFLLKFIIDVHPVSNFWILLGFTSCPPLILNLFRFLIHSRRNKSQ